MESRMLEVVHSWAAHGRGARCLAFCPGGDTLASAGEDRGNLGKTIAFWTSSTWRLRRRIKGVKGSVHRIAYSTDGRYLASAGEHGMLRLWDARNGELLREMKGHLGVVWALAFDPPARIIASGGQDGRLLLWNAATGEIVRVLHEGDAILSVAFSPDGQTLMSAEGAERRHSFVRLRNATTGKLMHTWTGHSDWPLWVAFCADPELVASASYGQILVRDATTGEPRSRLTTPNESMTCFALAPDGNTLAAGGWDHAEERVEMPGGWNVIRRGHVHFWNLRSGEHIRSNTPHERRVASVHFSPDGRLLASAGMDGKVMLWRIA